MGNRKIIERRRLKLEKTAGCVCVCARMFVVKSEPISSKRSKNRAQMRNKKNKKRGQVDAPSKTTYSQLVQHGGKQHAHDSVSTAEQ